MPSRIVSTNPTLADARNPQLVVLGERVRSIRARKGMTRKAVALAGNVSERHLASLELGIGNPSILVLQQVAAALQCPLAELVGDVTTASPEWSLIRGLLDGKDEADLQRARTALSQLFADPAPSPRPAAAAAPRRVALVGLRGAGKSTLGRLLADDLDMPFIELSLEIARLAGCSVSEIQDLYGMNAYRRYERRALDETVATHAEAVIATPGGLVSDAGTYQQLLRQCTTVWLRAAPEQHMQRVTAQGDLRPMAASTEAMDDLRRILAGRSAFYAKADLTIDTGAAPLEPTFARLRAAIRIALVLPT